MSIALAIFALIVVVASVSGTLFPTELLSYVREVIVGPGIWWAVGARFILAALLWFSAPVSRTPITFRILAILALLGATFIVAVGSEGVLQIVDWLASWPLWGVRLDFTGGVAFGLFLLWSILSKRTNA